MIGAEKIEGKAAALDVVLGQGHVILIGFRTQWRGQSHGTYKFLFNAMYYNNSMAPALPAAAEPPKEGGRGGGRGRGNAPPATPPVVEPDSQSGGDPVRALSLLTLTAILGIAQIPTPESVLGHKPGDDFYLATYDDALNYFQKLAASSKRIKLVKVGKTTQGRDWYMAFISTPENLAQLDHYKEVSRRLALSRGVSDAEARKLAHDQKAIIHIDGGLHATEVANAQHTIQLGYDLVASEEPEYKRIREDVITELWFSINPDGQNMVANWYRQNVGTPYEVSPLPYLWQEYVGHDNNRDGYMLNMIEAQVVTKATLETQPLVFYTHHQTAPFPGRIYLPPFADPISANMHPLMLRWLNLTGMTIASYLDEHGMPGSMHQETFDVWYPGYLDNVGNFRHTLSFFTETALYRYATPHFYTVDDFPASRQPLRAEMLYSSPWKGGWWRLADACRYMYGASMAVLDMAVEYREQMVYNKYKAARDTIEQFEKDPPYAYIIPREQHDSPTAALLLEKLMLQGIEVKQSADPDAWVIMMNQPFSGLVKELFEPQKYPQLSQRPYDVTGWTRAVSDGRRGPRGDHASVGEVQRFAQASADEERLHRRLHRAILACRKCEPARRQRNSRREGRGLVRRR